MKKWIFIILFVFTVNAGAEVLFNPQVNVSLSSGYSGVDSIDSTGLVGGNIEITPALIFSNDLALIPSIKSNLSTQQRSLQENTLFSGSAQTGASLALVLPVGFGRVPLHGEVTRSLNKRAPSEVWGEGLYDTQTISGGLGYAFEGKSKNWKANVDANIAKQSYPNYKDLSAELSGGKGLNFKDYISMGLSAGYGFRVARRVISGLTYNYQYRPYSDNFLVNTDGTVDADKKRSDQVHDIGLQLSWQPSSSLMVSTQLRWLLSVSNQGFFDTGNNRFIPSTEAFDVESLGLGLSWRATKKMALSINFGLENRNSELPIRSRDGQYSDGKQSDLSYSSSMSAAYSLPGGISLNATLSVLTQSSNQIFAAAGEPDYTMYNASGGLSWSWERY